MSDRDSLFRYKVANACLELRLDRFKLKMKIWKTLNVKLSLVSWNRF